LQETLLDSGRYELVAARDGVLRLRPAGSPVTEPVVLPPDFYTFVRPDTPADYNLAIDFSEVARLHGFSLHFNRQEEVQVSVDVALARPLEPGEAFRPVLYLLDDAGRPLGAAVDLPPALAWFPLDRWPVGEPVRVRFNTLPWPGFTRQGVPYRLALGLVNGPDVWTGPRYRPHLADTTGLYALRLPADGSLLELARIESRWGLPEGGPLRRRFTAAPSHKLNANFDRQLLLLGYDTPSSQLPISLAPDASPVAPSPQPLFPSPSPPTPTLAITLYWQAAITPEPLTRFVQLIGPDGRIYSQNDAAPDNGRYPTSAWLPGEVVVETVVLPLPPERPAGAYTLHLGLYRPDGGQRLPLLSGGDHIEIPVR
jgi:hypothetical protein